MESDRDDLILNRFVAQRLRHHRECKAITRENLARHLCIDIDMIERAESGEERLDALRLYEACQVLDVTLRSFFEGYELFREENHSGTTPSPTSNDPAGSQAAAP